MDVIVKLGHKVQVLKKTTRSLLRNTAGGLRAGPDVQTFIENYITRPKPYAITLDVLDNLDINGNVSSSRPANDPMHLTTWSALHRMFRDELLAESSEPAASYDTGHIVRSVKPDGNKIIVTYSETQESGSESGRRRADLVIGADRGHSTVRKSVLPHLNPSYAGYVTWRGAVPENILSEKTKSLLLNRCTIFRTEKRGYVVCYNVPSDTGSIDPGETQFIWVWYDVLPGYSEEFTNTFTDRNGVKHFTTVPRGQMQEQVWAKRREYGQFALNPPLAELLRKTREPFVSAIRDLASPNAVFHEGKLVLVGDAFTLFRPHVAMSTNQGAKQALGLARVLQGQATLSEWETESIKYAQWTSGFAKVFGEYSFSGKPTAELKKFLGAMPPGDPRSSRSRI